MRTAEAPDKRIRTTLSLPKEVYEEARALLKQNASPAESINAFFVAAISAYVRFLHRKKIDAQFEAMANDSAYRKQAQMIAGEFSQADWEAFKVAEKTE